MNHPNINRLVESGTDGVIVKPSGSTRRNVVFVVLEYVPGGCLFFDLCEKLGALRNNSGRFFIDQIVDTIKYMHDNNVIHGDLKLENMMVDEDMNIQLIDFGFATSKNIGNLTAYHGTKSYLAPEIRESKLYDGRQTDIFSLGVVIYIIVTGRFAFETATRTDKYYKLIIDEEYEKYWKKTGGRHLSSDFKDMIQKMLHYDPNKRPTIK